ncbi:MAG: Cell division protein FtsX [candidate division WS2 bacterium]|uniref:Cell division protein FtsX n=1 Tax=Psychracetigena formicireducens TaxID=2986056 RepID=A0A9E2BH84_PSYF1|nr:Cell division protein FtsX [Candidatus Psychracetigena formicireducens]MBT9144561.1 Cell division protein FtsX [Candidatus Psychracetigena formicireducens]
MEVTLLNINSLGYCLRQSIVSIYRNFWLVLVTAGIIAVSLSVFGGLLLIAVNTGQIIRNVESNVEIAIFLYDEANAEEIQFKLDNLVGVRNSTFVPKEQGLEEFRKSMNMAIPLDGLSGKNNPLPDLFRVKAVRAEIVPELAREIQEFPGVEYVEYGEKVIDILNRVTGWLNTVFLVISSLLALGAIFLIMTTIRISVLSRQEEIGIMKYLGASNSFIRFPFILEGMVIGWLGTLSAALVLGVVYYRLVVLLKQEALAFFVQPVTDMEILLPLLIGLLVIGTLLGGLGSMVSIHRHLKV